MNTAIRTSSIFPAFALTPVLLLAAALAAGAPALAESSQVLFGKYPAGGAYKGRPAAVDLRSHKDARTFRTRLRAPQRCAPTSPDT